VIFRYDSMRGFRVLFAAAIGLITYLLLGIFLGQAGVLESQRLLAYRSRLEANITDLDRIQAKLSERVQSLQSDPENVRLKARALGYFEPGENLIRLPGYDPNVEVTSPGALVYRTDHPSDPRSLFRAIAFGVGLLTYLMSLLGTELFTSVGSLFKLPMRALKGGHRRNRPITESLGRRHEQQPT